MRDGHVEQIGAPLDLYGFPDNTFVATFIGSPSMNLIEGTIRVGDKGTLFIANNGDKLPLGDRKIPDGTKAIYGIRPEHLALSDAERGIATKIILAEPMGSETQVLLALGGVKVVAAFRERTSYVIGDTIYVAPELNKICLFAADIGKRIA